MKNKKTIATLFLIVASGLFLIFNYTLSKNKKKKDFLENDSFKTYVTIEFLKNNVNNGAAGQKDVVYFFFKKNDTIIHKIYNGTSSIISNYNLKTGSVYEAKIANKDFGIFEINFENKKDTLIINDLNLFQTFEGKKHRRLITEL